MITARYYLAGAGASNTAALAFGGVSPIAGVLASAEKYNGSTWSAGGTMITARYQLAGAGASGTSALAFGGYDNDGNTVSCTERYCSGIQVCSI
jgi:hypothetical protein